MADDKAKDIWNDLPDDEGANATMDAQAPATPVPAGDVPVANAPVAPGGKRRPSDRTLTARKLQEELNANPEQAKRFKMWTDALEVTHSLGFSDTGSYIDTTRDTISMAISAGRVRTVPATDTTTDCFLTVDKQNGEILSGVVRLKKADGDTMSYCPTPQKLEDGTALPKEFVKKKDVAQLVGYTAKNIGAEPVLIYNSTCFKNASGVWEETPMATVTLNPGEEVQMTKKALALTGGLIEYSGAFANGTIYAKSKQVTAAELIDNTSFRFSGKSAGYEGLSVHSDTFKVRIDDIDEDGFYRVKDEFKEHFAILENEGRNKNKKNGKRANTRAAFDSSDIISKMIRDAMNSGNVL